MCLVVLCSSVLAQQFEEYVLLPKEYETPEPGMEASLESERSNEPWWVYADRTNVLIYEDRYLQKVIDTAHFLEPFVVWQESLHALRLVSRSEPGDLFFNDLFSERAAGRGWIQKEHLIVWPQVLRKEGLQMKVIVPGSVSDPDLSESDKPFQPFEIPPNEFMIFNVIKTDGEDLLLMRSDQMHEDLSPGDLFWINRSKVFMLESRKAYVPRWDWVSEGDQLPVYESRSGALNQASESILYAINTINPYIGFLKMDEAEGQLVESFTPFMGEMKGAFLNNDDQGFQKAYLLDDPQFQFYKRLIQLLSDNSLNEPASLEVALVEFFLSYGIPKEQIGTNSIARLFELVTGISLSDPNPDTPTRVGLIGYSKRRDLMLDYSNVLENLKPGVLNWYTFWSDLRYYWLPESWILPAEIAGLALSNTVIDTPTPKSYERFEVFYIDASSVKKMDTTNFKYMFDDFTEKIDQVLSVRKDNTAVGLYTYLSDGLHTIKNDRRKPIESTVDDMLMRFGEGTYFPDKTVDKLTMETELLTQQIESIQDSLVMHFYITQSFFDEDIWERGYMLLDLPERVYSLTMPKNDSKTTVYINLYAISDEEKLDRIIRDIKDYYGFRFNHIEFRFNKFNKYVRNTI